MVEVIKDSTPTARKFYDCDACLFITEGVSLNEFAGHYKLTFAEKRALIRAKWGRFQIYPGEKYIKQVNKQDGEVYTFRAIPEIHAINCKYGVYQDCY